MGSVQSEFGTSHNSLSSSCSLNPSYSSVQSGASLTSHCSSALFSSFAQNPYSSSFSFDSGASSTSQSSSAMTSSLVQSPHPLPVFSSASTSSSRSSSTYSSSNDKRGIKRKKKSNNSTDDTLFTDSVKKMQKIKQRIDVLVDQIHNLKKEQDKEIIAYNSHVKLLNGNKSKTGCDYSFSVFNNSRTSIYSKCV